MHRALVPKLFTTLKGYNRQQLVADVTAGVIVGVVALPLAIAFGIASGVTPERGLYTAIVAGFIISALGGSRVQIGGPTGAFVVIVYGIVQQYGIDGLAVATVMAGVLLIALGFARMGVAIKFIPRPVITGFTSGIAVIIFSSEVKDFLGLRMDALPAEFIAKWSALAAHAGTIHGPTIAVSAVSLIVIMLWPRVSRRVPGPFVALLAAVAITHLFHLDVETIGSRFGTIAAGLPTPRLPHITLALGQALVAPAFTIALLAAVESLLSAVVADGMIGGRHRSNMELIAQGVANIASPIFGGIPATGAIARTATNVKNGGRTPVAGIVHAITLLLITLFFGRWAALIPLAALAAILVVVAYHMSEWHSFVAELRAPRSDVVVMITTFLLTVLVDLTVAIEVGMVLAAFLFMRRMAETTNISVATADSQEDADGDDTLPTFAIPNGVQVYTINGPLFFGAAESFRDALRQVSDAPRVLIVRMRNVPAIDATGMHFFRQMIHRARADGTRVILSELENQPRAAMQKAGLMAEVGEENVVARIDEALELSTTVVGR